MPIRIFNNLPSLSAQRHLGVNNDRLGTTIGRVATGIRINNSADDGAGLALSEGLRSDTRALKQASRNLSDALSMIRVVEGGLQEQSGILIRLREIAAQAATGTIGQTERDTIQLEFSQLRAEFNRIAFTTEFNGIKLLDGTLAAGSSQRLEILVGQDSQSYNRLNLNQELDLEAVTALNLGFATESVSTQNAAQTALDSLVAAIDNLTQIRSSTGAVENRMERALANLNVSIENLTSAESNIRDADMAVELTRLTRDQILVESATAMVGQANLLPQGVFRLIEVP